MAAVIELMAHVAQSLSRLRFPIADVVIPAYVSYGDRPAELLSPQPAARSFREIHGSKINIEACTPTRNDGQAGPQLI